MAPGNGVRFVTALTFVTFAFMHDNPTADVIHATQAYYKAHPSHQHVLTYPFWFAIGWLAGSVLYQVGKKLW